jgi:TRAP-type C4-dicarboxylate transport system permease small subunit
MFNLFDRFVHALTLRTAQAAQLVLAFVMFIIVGNVISRIWWKPIPGTVELVEMSGAVLLALAVAYTAIMKGHIMVGVLVDRFPPRMQAAADIVVNTIALVFSFLLARETYVFGARMMQRGYTTGHLLLPIAPSIYLVAFGFTMLTLVLFRDLLKAVVAVTKGSETG